MNKKFLFFRIFLFCFFFQIFFQLSVTEVRAESFFEKILNGIYGVKSPEIKVAKVNFLPFNNVQNETIIPKTSQPLTSFAGQGWVKYLSDRISATKPAQPETPLPIDFGSGLNTFSTNPSIPKEDLADLPSLTIHLTTQSIEQEECKLPNGPVSYNIYSDQGEGTKCNAKTIMVGYKGKLSDLPNKAVGAGYMTPLVPKFDKKNTNLYRKDTVPAKDGYGARKFRKYDSPAALAFFDEQIIHWKKEGASAAQECVVVDLDNCDSIGGEEYKKLLDRIEFLNKSENDGGVQIKVLAKNPHLDGCNFMSHKAVVGAVVELGDDDGPKLVEKINSLRKNPDQTLVFARGRSGKQENLDKAKEVNIKNASFSSDDIEKSEYESITNCTYK